MSFQKPTPTESCSAIIAIGHRRTAIVVATNNAWLDMDTDAISDLVEDLGIDYNNYLDQPGVYLWVGTVGTELHSSFDGEEYETVYKGELRSIKPAEFEALLAMRPPFTEQDGPDDTDKNGY
jgi:hypothetical protein